MNLRDSVYFTKDANFVVAPRFQSSFKIGAVTVTANGTELNILDNALVSTTELNYLVGVTSNVQTQINSKVSATALSSYATLANPNFTGSARLASDSLMTKARVKKIINDSIQNRINNASVLGSYAWLKTDTVYGQSKQVVTQTQLASFSGGGSGMGMYELRGIVGTTTGFPTNGDSLIINTGFISHPHLLVYRGGDLQWYNYGLANNTGTTDSVYVFNQTSGTIIVRPTFVSGEKVIVHAFDPIMWTDLIPEGGTGGGGGSGASSLLTGLVGFWQFDETAGNTALDADGNTYPGTSTNVTVNQNGRFGPGYLYGGAGYTTMGTSIGLRLQTHSISCWVRTTQADYAGIVVNYIAYAGIPYGYHLTLQPNGTVEYQVQYNGAYNQIYSTTAVNDGNWHNIIATFNGTNTNIYIDGGSSEDTDATAGTIIYHSLNELHTGNRGQTDLPLIGRIDAVGLWSKVLSSGERTALQTSTYPF
jgi:hypothetical protein